DLTVALAEAEGELEGMLEYSSDLFDRETIVRLRNGFVELLRAAAADPSRRVSELPVTADEEKAALERFADGGPPWPEVHDLAPVHERIEASARTHPERIAVVAGGSRISYAALDHRATVLAERLIERGVAPGSFVVVCGARSAELVAGIIAILKAGAAYVP